MTSLYDLTEELAEVVRQIAEAEGEMTPELQARFDELCPDINQKAENTCKFILSRQADAETCKAESDRLRQRAKTYENEAARVKARMLYIMQSHDMTKAGTATHRATRLAGRSRVDIIDMDKIPVELAIVEIKPDKAAIKQLLEAGHDAGAELVIGEESLRIY